MTPLEQARQLANRAAENALKAIAIHENCKIAYRRKRIVESFKKCRLDQNFECLRWAILDSLILSLSRLYDKSSTVASLSKFQRVVNSADVARELRRNRAAKVATQRSIEQGMSQLVRTRPVKAAETAVGAVLSNVSGASTRRLFAGARGSNSTAAVRRSDQPGDPAIGRGHRSARPADRRR